MVPPQKPNNPPDPVTLFPLPPPASTEPRVRRLQVPMWTAHKARFIERYLYDFVLVTKHGTYVDGFAGPQQPDDAEMWTAKRVLESEPRWLRHFYLFDRSSAQVSHLQALKQAQRPPDRTKKEPRRTIHVEQGDFNSLVEELLRSAPFSQREAVFWMVLAGVPTQRVMMTLQHPHHPHIRRHGPRSYHSGYNTCWRINPVS